MGSAVGLWEWNAVSGREVPWKRNVPQRDPWRSPTFKVQVEETPPAKETEEAQP